MRSIFLLLLCCAAVGLASAEAPPLDNSMPEDYLPQLRPLLKQAVESSPTTIIANIAVAQYQASLYFSTSTLYPNIAANASYLSSTESVSNGNPQTQSGLFYSVSIIQPLFQWGALKNQAAIAKLQLLVSQRQFDDAYRLLAAQVREQFLILAQKKIALRNSQFNLKLTQENLTVQKSRFDAGASSQAELSNYQLVVEQAQLDTDRAQEDYANSKQLFVRLLGLDTLDDNIIPLELPHPEFKPALADAVLAGFVGGGVESTFQSQVYKLYEKQQDLSLKIANVRLLPKFTVGASFNYQNNSTVGNGVVTQAGIQTEQYNVTANWQIFDGFATRGARRSAQANKRLYERQLKTYEDSSIDQMTNMRHSLGFSARAMTLTEVHTALLDAQVKRLNQDLTLGYASQASVDAGLQGLYATQMSQAVARGDFYSRWVDFISLAGIDPALANLPTHYGR